MLCTIPRFNRRRFRRYYDTARGLVDDVRTVATGDPAEVAERWFHSEGGWQGVRNRWRQAYETGQLSRIEATDPYAEWLFRPQQPGGSDKFGGTFSSARSRTVAMPRQVYNASQWAKYQNVPMASRAAYPGSFGGRYNKMQAGSYRSMRFNRTGGYTGFPSILNGELKFHDVQLTNAAAINAGDGQALATTSGGTYSVNLIPQDTSSQGRIGRKAVIKSIEAKVGFHVESIEDAPGDLYENLTMHFFLVLDTQANGAIFTDGDVWKFEPDPLPRAATADKAFCPLPALLFRNLENIQRFRVIRHIVVPYRRSGFYVTSTTSAGNLHTVEGQSAVKTLYMKCNIPIEFETGATAPTITSVRTNNLQWFAFPNGAVLNASIPDLGQYHVFANTRLRFTDVGSSKTLTRMGKKRVKRSGS